MKLLKTTLLAIGLLLSIASCSPEDNTEDNVLDYTIDLNLAEETDWEMAEEILILINEHRASIGLGLILKDQQYASAYAVDHTKYMIQMSDINHDNFHYRKQALKSQGAQKVGENVAFGYDNAQSVVTAWLNSPSHKRAIEGDYTHSGFGIVSTTSGNTYYTQLFYKN